MVVDTPMSERGLRARRANGQRRRRRRVDVARRGATGGHQRSAAKSPGGTVGRVVADLFVFRDTGPRGCERFPAHHPEDAASATPRTQGKRCRGHTSDSRKQRYGSKSDGRAHILPTAIPGDAGDTVHSVCPLLWPRGVSCLRVGDLGIRAPRAPKRRTVSFDVGRIPTASLAVGKELAPPPCWLAVSYTHLTLPTKA